MAQEHQWLNHSPNGASPTSPHFNRPTLAGRTGADTNPQATSFSDPEDATLTDIQKLEKCVASFERRVLCAKIPIILASSSRDTLGSLLNKPDQKALAAAYEQIRIAESECEALLKSESKENQAKLTEQEHFLAKFKLDKKELEAFLFVKERIMRTLQQIRTHLQDVINSKRGTEALTVLLTHLHEIITKVAETNDIARLFSHMEDSESFFSKFLAWRSKLPSVNLNRSQNETSSPSTPPTIKPGDKKGDKVETKVPRPPSPSNTGHTYFLPLSLFDTKDAKLTEAKKLEIQVEALENLAKALGISTSPASSPRGAGDVSPSGNISEQEALLVIKERLIHPLEEIRDRLERDRLELEREIDEHLDPNARLKKVKSLKNLHKNVVEIIKRITEATDIRDLSYAMIDIQDFLLTGVRVPGVIHTVKNKDAYNILTFLQANQGVAVTYVTIFALGALAYGADQIAKKRAAELNADPVRVFDELVKLYKKNREALEEINKERDAKSQLKSLSFEEWRQEVNKELVNILDQEDALTKIDTDEDKEKRLSDYYSQMRLTWVADSEKNGAAEYPTKWAFELSAQEENLGVKPDEIKTFGQEMKRVFLEFMDDVNHFLTITALWFWVFWMNLVVYYGSTDVLNETPPFIKFGIQFAWAVCFGLSYIGRVGFNYTSRYISTKTNEVDFKSFNNLIFRSFTPALVESFPGLKSFFDKWPTLPLVIDALAYIFYKAPLQAVAFPSIVLSTLCAATEKAIEEGAWGRGIPLFILSLGPMIAAMLLYLPVSAINKLAAKISKPVQAILDAHPILKAFCELLSFPFRLIWQLVNLPVQTGVSLWCRIRPGYMGFKKKIDVSEDELTKVDTQASTSTSRFPHSPSARKTNGHYESGNIFLDKQENLRLKEKRNERANTHAITVIRRLMLWEKARHQSLIQDHELEKEKAEIEKILQRIPKEIGKPSINTGYTRKDKYAFKMLYEKYFPTTAERKAFSVGATTFFSWWAVAATLLFVGWMVFEFINAASPGVLASSAFLTATPIIGFIFCVLSVAHAIYQGYGKYKELKEDESTIEKNKTLYEAQAQNHLLLEESEHNIAFYWMGIRNYVNRLIKCGYDISKQEKDVTFLQQKSYPHSLVEEAHFFLDVTRDERKPQVDNANNEKTRRWIGYLLPVISMIILPGLLFLNVLWYDVYWLYTATFFTFLVGSSLKLLDLKRKNHPDYEYYKAAFYRAIKAGMAVQSGILFVRLFLYKNSITAMWLPTYLFGMGTPGFIAGLSWIIPLFIVIGLGWAGMKILLHDQNVEAKKFTDLMKNLPERNAALEKEVTLSQQHEELLRQRYELLHQICRGMPSLEEEPRSVLSTALSRAQISEGHIISNLELLCGNREKEVVFQKQGNGYVFMTVGNSVEKPGKIYINTHDCSAGEVAIYYRPDKEDAHIYHRMLYRADYFPCKGEPVVLEIAGAQYKFSRSSNGLKLIVNEFGNRKQNNGSTGFQPNLWAPAPRSAGPGKDLNPTQNVTSVTQPTSHTLALGEAGIA